MELPNELVRQHDETVARNAEAAQWAYAVAFALYSRRRAPRSARVLLDKHATTIHTGPHSTRTLKLMAAKAARDKNSLRASALVRAVAKRIIKGDHD